MTIYVPNPAGGYPSAGIHLPDDGVTKRTAASVNRPMQEIVDGLAFVKEQADRMQAETIALSLQSAQALNWGPPVALPDPVLGGAWDAVGLRWIVCGDRISSSFDGFNFVSEYTTGGPYTDVATDAGVIVAATAGRNVALYNGTWATVDVYGAAATERAVVARANGYWLWFGQGGQIRRSPTGAPGTWTAVGALFGGESTTRALCVSPVTGTVVASVYDHAIQRTRMLRSINDGATWETLATATGPAYPAVTTRMRCAKKSGGRVTWMLASTGPLRSTVDVSHDDGLTWQRVFTSFLTLVCSPAFTPNGDAGIWVAVDASTHQVICSSDDGATWRYCNWRNPFAIPTLTNYESHDFLIEGPNGLALGLKNGGGSGAFAQGLRLSTAGAIAP